MIDSNDIAALLRVRYDEMGENHEQAANAVMRCLADAGALATPATSAPGQEQSQ